MWLINLSSSKQTPKVLHIDGGKILVGRIVDIEDLHDGSKSLSELVAPDRARREHGHNDLNFFIQLHEF